MKRPPSTSGLLLDKLAGRPDLNSGLDRLRCGEGKEFDKFLFNFMEITGRLAAIDRPLSDAVQVMKLIRVPSESFALLTMPTNSVTITFNRISAAVQSEIARCANPSNPRIRAIRRA